MTYAGVFIHELCIIEQYSTASATSGNSFVVDIDAAIDINDAATIFVAIKIVSVIGYPRNRRRLLFIEKISFKNL
jgi:hypothetical protein